MAVDMMAFPAADDANIHSQSGLALLKVSNPGDDPLMPSGQQNWPSNTNYTGARASGLDYIMDFGAKVGGSQKYKWLGSGFNVGAMAAGTSGVPLSYTGDGVLLSVGLISSTREQEVGIKIDGITIKATADDAAHYNWANGGISEIVSNPIRFDSGIEIWIVNYDAGAADFGYKIEYIEY